jgi:hypothetical protein
MIVEFLNECRLWSLTHFSLCLQAKFREAKEAENRGRPRLIWGDGPGTTLR